MELLICNNYSRMPIRTRETNKTRVEFQNVLQVMRVTQTFLIQIELGQWTQGTIVLIMPIWTRKMKIRTVMVMFVKLQRSLLSHSQFIWTLLKVRQHLPTNDNEMAKSFEIPNSVCTPRFNAQKPNLSYKDLKPEKKSLCTT